ncbi:WXG100-like domain-containing protein, partial [Streptomyces sp. NPDC001177]
MGESVRSLRDRIADSLGDVRGAIPDEAAEQYIQAMSMLTGGRGGVDYLGQFADQLVELEAGQVRTSQDILQSKIEMIYELAVLIAELAFLAAVNPFTGGLLMGMQATWMADSAVALLVMLEQLLSRLHIMPGITEAIEEALTTFAANLTMMTAVKDGRRVHRIDWGGVGRSGLFGFFAGAFISKLVGVGGVFKHAFGDIVEDKITKIGKEFGETGWHAFAEGFGEGAAESTVNSILDGQAGWNWNTVSGGAASGASTKYLHEGADGIGTIVRNKWSSTTVFNHPNPLPTEGPEADHGGTGIGGDGKTTGTPTADGVHNPDYGAGTPQPFPAAPPPTSLAHSGPSTHTPGADSFPGNGDLTERGGPPPTLFGPVLQTPDALPDGLSLPQVSDGLPQTATAFTGGPSPADPGADSFPGNGDLTERGGPPPTLFGPVTPDALPDGLSLPQVSDGLPQTATAFTGGPSPADPGGGAVPYVLIDGDLPSVDGYDGYDGYGAYDSGDDSGYGSVPPSAPPSPVSQSFPPDGRHLPTGPGTPATVDGQDRLYATPGEDHAPHTEMGQQQDQSPTLATGPAPESPPTPAPRTEHGLPVPQAQQPMPDPDPATRPHTSPTTGTDPGLTSRHTPDHLGHGQTAGLPQQQRATGQDAHTTDPALDSLRQHTVPVRREHGWTSPGQVDPFAPDWVKPPMVPVHSAFDVRRFLLEGQPVTDVTMHVELVAPPTLSGADLEAVWQRIGAGVQELNTAAYRTPDGDRLHFTVAPAIAGTDPHIHVQLVTPDTGQDMTHQVWRTDAPAHEYAWQIGRLAGLIFRSNPNHPPFFRPEVTDSYTLDRPDPLRTISTGDDAAVPTRRTADSGSGLPVLGTSTDLPSALDPVPATAQDAPSSSRTVPEMGSESGTQVPLTPQQPVLAARTEDESIAQANGTPPTKAADQHLGRNAVPTDEEPLFPPSSAPDSGQTEAPYASVEELLSDLHASVLPSREEGKPAAGTRLLGPDLFGTRRAAPPPEFLAGHDYSSLTGGQIVTFFNRLDMVQPTPTRESMAPAAIEPAEGWSLVKERSGAELRAWAPGRVPPLPAKAEMPYVISSIWLGGPLRNAWSMADFRQNQASMARQHAGTAKVALWTDVPRALFEQAKADPTDSDSAELIEVRDMLTWAQDSGVMLLNTDEVFNSASPMLLHDFYRTETAKQVGPGYAAASDILRWEITYRFGGIYLDGDALLYDLSHVLEAFHSPQGFAIDKDEEKIGNSVIMMPKGHPFGRAFLDEIRKRYEQTQLSLMREYRSQPPQYFSTADGMVRRNSVMSRTGPGVVEPVALRLGMEEQDLLNLDGVQVDYALSWVTPPPSSADAREVTGRSETLRTAQLMVQTLVREIYNRKGDLHLTLVDPVLRGHPQRDLILAAVIMFIASRGDLASKVTGITDRREDLEGEWRVELPASVRDLLDFDTPAAQGKKPAHWLGEYQTPVVLRAAASSPTEGAGPSVSQGSVEGSGGSRGRRQLRWARPSEDPIPMEVW